MFDLKSIFLEGYVWESGFKFEIIYTKSGVARIYINDRKTSYTAGGWGYDKESSVIATMLNDLLGYQNYSAKEYGNSQGYKRKKSERKLDGGTGFSRIRGSFNSLRGNKLERIYSGFNSDVYSVQFSPRIIAKLKGSVKCAVSSN